MIIQVKIRNVYGNELIYPVCSKAKIFASLKSQSTLTAYDIRLIKALGYTIEVVSEVKTL
jgi:hypothetical protein